MDQKNSLAGPLPFWPKVFVISLNWNGKKWLEDCLASLLCLDYPNFEVLMVDNGSTDGSVEYIRSRFPKVFLLELGHNHGYEHGFNFGLRYAADRGADFFLIINNDIVIDPGALKALVDTALSEEQAGFVTGKVYYYDAPEVFQTLGKELDSIRWQGDHIGRGEKDCGQYDQVTERVFLDGVFTLIDRRVYDQVGGYDPIFFLECEEFDWQARAKRFGWRSYYTPHARLWHKGSMSMGGIGNPVGPYFVARNFIVVMARNAGMKRFIIYYLHISLQMTRLLFGGLFRMDKSLIKHRLASLLGFFAGTLWLVHRRPATGIPRFLRALK